MLHAGKCGLDIDLLWEPSPPHEGTVTCSSDLHQCKFTVAFLCHLSVSRWAPQRMKSTGVLRAKKCFRYNILVAVWHINFRRVKSTLVSVTVLPLVRYIHAYTCLLVSAVLRERKFTKQSIPPSPPHPSLHRWLYWWCVPRIRQKQRAVQQYSSSKVVQQ